MHFTINDCLVFILPEILSQTLIFIKNKPKTALKLNDWLLKEFIEIKCEKN